MNPERPTFARLLDISISVAERAASQHLADRQLDADRDALRAELNAHIEARFAATLDSAKDRLVACVAEIAEELFVAAMEGAGIEAAEQVGKPRLSLAR